MHKIIVANGHKIEIKNTLFGKESVYYDGQIVSSQRSIGGTTHIFKVSEDGIDVAYEVELSLRWHGASAATIVRRNGIILYSDK